MAAKSAVLGINIETFIALPVERLRECLYKQRVSDLRSYCRKKNLKLSPGSKQSDVIETILSYRDMGLISTTDDSEGSRITTYTHQMPSDLPEYGWSKDTSSLPDFTFMNLYTYLTESRDKTFDADSMKAFKSLKAYKYFADGFVQNASMLSDNSVLYIRAQVTASLTSKVYPVWVGMDQNSGEVYGGKCTCVAG